MIEVESIRPDWSGEPAIVAAPGPSLTPEVVRRLRFARWMAGWRVLAVQDSYKVMPWADALYGCDPHWWAIHRDCDKFAGEKWSTHEFAGGREQHINDKTEAAKRYGLHLVRGRDGESFSLDPSTIHYGSNSGFQAIGLALLKGCKRIVLVGFDMRRVGGKSHFFGEHPPEFGAPPDYARFLPAFDRAAKLLPADVEIINATPRSALRCFPAMALDDALAVGVLAGRLI